MDRIAKILEASDSYKQEALDAYYDLILETHGSEMRSIR